MYDSIVIKDWKLFSTLTIIVTILILNIVEYGKDSWTKIDNIIINLDMILYKSEYFKRFCFCNSFQNSHSLFSLHQEKAWSKYSTDKISYNLHNHPIN